MTPIDGLSKNGGQVTGSIQPDTEETTIDLDTGKISLTYIQ